MKYRMAELMVAAAAREIKDGEVVFVGMRLPLLAYLLAKETHARGAFGLFENGVVRDLPALESLYTMSDPPNILRALRCCDMLTVMSLLQRGVVDVGFIGAAEIDRFGNINTTYIRTQQGSTIRLTGSGGACDIASLSRRLLVIMTHERRRLVEKVSYITSPGYGTGGGWRGEIGLPRGGPSAVITTKGVMRFDPNSGEAYLASYHPGVTLEDIKANTGWDLRVPPDVAMTEPPTPQELAIIRRYDPLGHWTG